jgi:hypothetical protein
MDGCTAVNCSNTRSEDFRLFRFRRDPKRRKIWLQNFRRDKWQPTNASELCEVRKSLYKVYTRIISHY